MRLSTYIGLLVFATLLAAFAHADAGQQPPQQQMPQQPGEYPMPQQPGGPMPPPVMAPPIVVPTGIFCSLFPVGDGTIAIIQNNEVELYRGFAANVQGVLIHYQRIGVCPQVL